MVKPKTSKTTVPLRAAFTCVALTFAMVVLPSAALLGAGDDWDAQGPAPMDTALNRVQFDVEANVLMWSCGCRSQAQAHQKAESVLAMRVNAFERAGGLSSEQADKLRLAGREDARRLFRKLDELMSESHGITFNDRKFQEIYPKANALRQEFNNGQFSEDSLFAKVLNGIAHDNPDAPYLKVERERRRFRYRAAIEMAVMSLEFSVPLTDVQRQKLLKLLFDQLEPPRRLGAQANSVVLLQISKLDEAKLKPIFEEKQWKAFSRHLDRAKAMEPHLKQMGFLP